MSNIYCSSKRTEVQLTADTFNEALEQSKLLLVNSKLGTPVYCYGGRLVEVGLSLTPSPRDLLQKSNGKEICKVIFKSVTESVLRVRLNKIIRFTGEGGKTIFPSQSLIRAILDSPEFAKPLTGIIDAPTITPDGTELTKHGYNKETGLFCNLDRSLATDLPSNPSHEDAINSADQILNSVFADFPFKEDIDRSAALSMLLTSFQRRFLSNAPGFMVTATTQASGKSTLVDLVFRISYGKPAPASNWTTNQEEMGKIITGALLSGVCGLCFDNIEHGSRVEGDQLAKLITNEIYENRILRTNNNFSAPTGILLALTGNQLSAIGDMRSRLIPISLEPDVENPAARKFSVPNISSWVDENRALLVKNVYTIIKAWHCAGKPSVEITSSRFPDWDKIVRQQVRWLSQPDPGLLFQRNTANDPELEAQRNFFEALYSRFGDSAFTAGDILGEQDGFKLTLQEALLELYDDSLPSARQLGRDLSHMDGLIRGQYLLRKLPKSSKSKKSQKYKIIPIQI